MADETTMRRRGRVFLPPAVLDRMGWTDETVVELVKTRDGVLLRSPKSGQRLSPRQRRNAAFGGSRGSWRQERWNLFRAKAQRREENRSIPRFVTPDLIRGDDDEIAEYPFWHEEQARTMTIPREEFDRLREAADDLADLRAFDGAKAALAAGEDELVPGDYAKRLIAGESPLPSCAG
ncbi:MAG: hypothetical protein HEQ22_00235 [Sphingopyxis sp.]|uniref:hypothetical protein n=1 Tax=Sphingopyxis sp. TaxID=1908224 RepID=UPI003D80CDA2